MSYDLFLDWKVNPNSLSEWVFHINMFNKTEEVCVLGNWNWDISINLEQIEQQLLLQDPYDSIWLKFLAILFYFIGLLTSAIMLAFIKYESGHHGNFRSVINQLLSNLYAIVSLLNLPIENYTRWSQNWDTPSSNGGTGVVILLLRH